ncbi:MAG: murein L,D-transpeptidase [Microcystis sp. LE19-4.1E]|nr:murein L,D-transpeptidase [Microcystis sp. LE19-4.1E]
MTKFLLMRQFTFRKALGVAVIAGTITLSGCLTTDLSQRHLAPIPAALLSDMSAKNMSPSDPIMVRIFKKESELEVWKRDSNGDFALLKTYPMCRWSGQLGPKRKEGDRQAPEGFYTVTPDLMNPRSQFHLSFNLGYPNALEREQGFTGSALMVHGACTSAGCFAMTDEGVTEIYVVAREAFAAGQKSFQVQAFPFRMSAENMARHRHNPNIAFWRNLKDGADHFDATRQPPKLATCGRRYVFNPKEGSGPFTASEACPPYEIDPAMHERVASYRSSEERKIAEYTAKNMPALTLKYVDGGMHPRFRTILQSRGPEHLQALTSGRVEVSRPDAALADPYTPDGLFGSTLSSLR